MTVADRLYHLGLTPGTRVTLTRNRTVLISWHARSGLRLHAGYAAAPDEILQAIVRFVARRVPRAERAAARRVFMAFPIELHATSRPERPGVPRPVPPMDQPLVDRLTHMHELLNERHFAGALGVVPIRISDRMRSRLGELRAASSRGFSRGPIEIALSRRHLRRDGWDALCDTLLHEMVHQWQAENGHALDHGREFRRKAKEVGITPRAVADLRSG
jgi:hypothetical protein